MKKTIHLIAGISLCLIATSFHLRAADAAPATTPTTTIGKNHEDINQWLNDHPKMKAKILAKFDTNKNGILDGDEITAFLKWRKERREKKEAEGETGKGNKGNGSQGTTTTTPPAITSPVVQ